MWQKLLNELELLEDQTGQNFIVIAVAMDVAAAARPWIEAARPTYPCLIDAEHHVADLYHMVNVPQAVWIDETGRMVRPPENAGASDAFRKRDQTTGQLAADLIEARELIKAGYIEAVRDWVVKGAASEYALDAAAMRARVQLPDDRVAEAHAHFRLAQVLLAKGNAGEAHAQFAEASRLHPDSWNIWRQAAWKEPSGLASGPEFWARVQALGDRPYYQPVELKGGG